MKGGVEAQARPALVQGLKHVVSITAGSNHCVAVTDDGKNKQQNTKSAWPNFID